MHTTDICKQQIKVKTATPTTKNYKVKDTRDRIRYMPKHQTTNTSVAKWKISTPSPLHPIVAEEVCEWNFFVEIY